MLENEVIKQDYETFLHTLNWDFFEKKTRHEDNVYIIEIIEKDTQIIVASHRAALYDVEGIEHRYFLHYYPCKERLVLPTPIKRIVVKSWEELQQIVNLIQHNGQEGSMYLDMEQSIDLPVIDVDQQIFLKELQEEIESKVLDKLKEEDN